MSRINAIFRRSQHFQQTTEELCSNGITIQLLEGRAYKNGVLIEPTAAEYKLLRFFMEQPDIILSTEQIMGRLWDCDGNFLDGNTLAVYIRRLRLQDQSMEDAAAVQKFTTLSEQELDRVESLVQSLLKMARLDAGAITLEQSSENLSELMEHIKGQHSFRAELEGKKIGLEGDEQVSLLCDRIWMTEAIGNLLKNALDHTHAPNAAIRPW